MRMTALDHGLKAGEEVDATPAFMKDAGRKPQRGRFIVTSATGDTFELRPMTPLERLSSWAGGARRSAVRRFWLFVDRFMGAYPE